jgi:hypothetical protein
LTNKNKQQGFKIFNPFLNGGVFYFTLFYYICTMENRSTHYGDISKWIEKVIDSCETYQQTFAVRKLIRNFTEQLQRKHPDKYWRDYFYDIISPLEIKLSYKRDELLKQQLES